MKSLIKTNTFSNYGELSHYFAIVEHLVWQWHAYSD